MKSSDYRRSYKIPPPEATADDDSVHNSILHRVLQEGYAIHRNTLHSSADLTHPLISHEASCPCSYLEQDKLGTAVRKLIRAHNGTRLSLYPKSLPKATCFLLRFGHELGQEGRKPRAKVIGAASRYSEDSRSRIRGSVSDSTTRMEFRFRKVRVGPGTRKGRRIPNTGSPGAPAVLTSGRTPLCGPPSSRRVDPAELGRLL
jgi:hypothetical protein